MTADLVGLGLVAADEGSCVVAAVKKRCYIAYLVFFAGGPLFAILLLNE